MADDQIEQTSKNLGRLTSLGPQAPWQVALLLPRTWDDLRPTVADFTPSGLFPRLGQTLVLRGGLAVAPTVHYQPIPRTQATISDVHGHQVAFTIFGNTRETCETLTSHRDNLCLWGRIDQYQGRLQLSNAEIVHPAWAGRLRPRYPGKPSVIGATLVRERVVANLRDALPAAQTHIIQHAASGDEARLAAWIEHFVGEPLTLQQLLIRAHVPRNPDQGEQAQRTLDQLNALAVVNAAAANRESRGQSRWNAPGDWHTRAAALPFTLNTYQQRALGEILTDMTGRVPMHRLLAGDVGTGKTAVYGLAAAVAADAGARVAVLAPNTGLASQIAANLTTWWPDLDMREVTGATKKNNSLVEHRLLVGTTALLHRDTGPLDMVVVDEQHKFSRAQREALLASGCHLLEATATCTPRSQALVELGVRENSYLRRHDSTRRVETRLWLEAQRRDLMAAIESTLAQDEQVLVIYPERGDGEQGGKKDAQTARRQAAEAYELWHQRFPGQVALSHGGLSASDKNAALDAMRANKARILISTTVVEVGIDLTRLTRVVIIHADRLGLVTLHQIRGRVARAGGTGYCDLFVAGDQSESATERLNVLCRTDDGFEVAEADLRLRGFGDLSADSEDEKGFRDGVFFQRAVRVEDVEAIANLPDLQ